MVFRVPISYQPCFTIPLGQDQLVLVLPDVEPGTDHKDRELFQVFERVTGMDSRSDDGSLDPSLVVAAVGPPPSSSHRPNSWFIAGGLLCGLLR